MAHTVYLGLGSNLGDRLAHLQAVGPALTPQVRLLAASPIYETAPWGFAAQPAFLNQVLKVETELSPFDLIKALKRVEVDLGRKPTFHYGPRQIDVDILFYDNLILETLDLVIPHPRLAERAFVLVPLADLAPDLIHPSLNKTIRELLAEVDPSGVQPSK